ncbi:polysaccharide pyruvyl transferase family protein [Modestobacter sp. SYSU DS0290]
MRNGSPISLLQDQTREILGRFVGRGIEVSLLDFPRHDNAGDALIWLGERSYLRDLDLSARYMATLHHLKPEELRRRVPDGPILLHGGGNLGDRWPENQAFRERVVGLFPDRRIIQMPQSIEFRERASLERARRVFNAHPDLTLLMRDHDAVEVARSAFPQAVVEFCPDVALGVGRVERTEAPKCDALLLLRQDSEASGHGFRAQGVDALSADWALTGMQRAIWLALRMPENISRVVEPLTHSLYPLNARSMDAMARVNVRAARGILQQGRVVVTDRLHAMVLAALLSIPVVGLDNSYGKLSRIFRDYLGELPGVYFASDAEEAQSLMMTALSVQK